MQQLRQITADRSSDGSSAAHGALLRRARRYAGGEGASKAEEAPRRGRRHGAVRGDGAGADGGEDGVPRRPAGARVHGAVRAQDGEVRYRRRRRRRQEEAAAAGGDGEGEGGVGVGLRELRGRVAARDGGADARAAAGGRARGAPLHAPPDAPEQFRKLFPPTRWACEFNAALTVPFFHWLVGPSEVIEVEVNGVKQKSGVLIKKCR